MENGFLLKGIQRRWIVSTFVALVLLAAASMSQAWWWKKDKAETTVLELTWEDLIPDDFVPATNPFETMTQEEIDKLLDGSEESRRRLAEYDAMMAYAPTVPELQDKRVKIPGYVVPLDFDGQTELEEFLLVPYYGACIHTPPPPANQVVHAKTERNAVKLEDPWLPVWAIGVMQVETVTSSLAESGYRLRLESIEPYELDQ